jgi:hypothetical protein
LKFKNIILEEKLSNKLNNSYDNFSSVKVYMILGLLPWISYDLKSLDLRGTGGAKKIPKTVVKTQKTQNQRNHLLRRGGKNLKIDSDSAHKN